MWLYQHGIRWQQPMIFHIIKRFKKHKIHWSEKQRLVTHCDRALKHFDDFYGSVYGARWPGMRAALLSEPKYIAVVNNFGDSEETQRMLEADGAMDLRLVYTAALEHGPSPVGSHEITNSGVGTSPLDESLADFMNKQKTTEIDAIYEHDVNEGLAKMEEDKEKSRVLEPLDMANFNTSLEEAIDVSSELDYNRIISAEIGIAGLQEFVPATKIKGMEGYVPESQHYQYYNTTANFPLNIELENSFTFPENLKAYTFERGNISRFPLPVYSTTGGLTHFIIQGASLLPPLLLDVQPGDSVFDACSAPGGKSLVLLQTLNPGLLVCNDLYDGRLKHVSELMKKYIPNFEEYWHDKCIIQRSDAINSTEFRKYDRILVDVPSTADRSSTTENEESMFRPDVIRERLRIPEFQSDLLVNCMRLLKPGGSLVYTTASLSPIQNDGIVNMALTKVFAAYNITFTIKDLSNIIHPLRSIFRFENPKNMKYGQLVLPYLPANFGPTYICKLTRSLKETPKSKTVTSDEPKPTYQEFF